MIQKLIHKHLLVVKENVSFSQYIKQNEIIHLPKYNGYLKFASFVLETFKWLIPLISSPNWSISMQKQDDLPFEKKTLKS